MKHFLIVPLWLFIVSIAFSQSDLPPLGTAIKDWRTVRISIVIDEGDNITVPFLLLQRLDAERVFLSSGDGRNLPVARALMNPEAAGKIIDRALEFYAKAQKEIGEEARIKTLPVAEQALIAKKATYGIGGVYIRIEILGAKRVYKYEEDFAIQGAYDDFGDFIMREYTGSK